MESQGTIILSGGGFGRVRDVILALISSTALAWATMTMTGLTNAAATTASLRTSGLTDV